MNKVKEPPTERRCQRCKDVFPINQFYSHKSMSGGRAYVCKKCNNIIVRKGEYKRSLRKDRAGFLSRMAQQTELLRLMVEVLTENPS